MTENRITASSFGARALRAWPWLTAVSELIALTSLGVLCVANELRVALSYHPETPARDAVYARYVLCEDISAAVLRWAAISLIPVVLGQCIGWSWIRRATAGDRRVARLMPITTLVGLVLLAFIGFLCTVAVSATMVG